MQGLGCGDWNVLGNTAFGKNQVMSMHAFWTLNIYTVLGLLMLPTFTVVKSVITRIYFQVFTCFSVLQISPPRLIILKCA
jgi:hypothetical protein